MLNLISGQSTGKYCSQRMCFLLHFDFIVLILCYRESNQGEEKTLAVVSKNKAQYCRTARGRYYVSSKPGCHDDPLYSHVFIFWSLISRVGHRLNLNDSNSSWFQLTDYNSEWFLIRFFSFSEAGSKSSFLIYIEFIKFEFLTSYSSNPRTSI